MKSLKKSAIYLLAIAVLILLYFSGQYNYLLFHIITEVFSICIAITVFFITWNSLHLLKNNYLIIVGIAYLFIGFLDLFHTISFPGMTIFTDYDYHANQLWVAARGFESIVLLVAFVFLKSKKKVNTSLLITIYSVLTVLTLLTIFIWGIFPIAYIEGVGQTPFKIISEFAIIVILLIALLALFKQKELFNRKVCKYLVVSILFTVASETCFLVYFSSYDIFNMLGHYFKIISFFYIYKSIIQTGIREPYDLIFRELKQTEQQLHEQNSILSHQSVADGLTIKEHLSLLREQYGVLNRQARLLDLSHEAIFARDLIGRIFYWNKGAELMYGYTAEEAIGQPSDELLKTQRLNNSEKTKCLLEKYWTWMGEQVQTTKDGRQLTVETAHQLYHEEDGRQAILEICRDVTEHTKMEADLRYQNDLLFGIIENMHDALFVYDMEGSVTMANARAREMYPGHFTQKVTVGNVFDKFTVLDLERKPLPVNDYPTRRAFRGESIDNEKVIIETDRRSIIIEVNATPIMNAQKQIIAIVVVHHDITELINRQHAIV